MLEISWKQATTRKLETAGRNRLYKVLKKLEFTYEEGQSNIYDIITGKVNRLLLKAVGWKQRSPEKAGTAPYRVFMWRKRI